MKNLAAKPLFLLFANFFCVPVAVSSQTFSDSTLVARINFGGSGAAPSVSGWSDLNPWQKKVTGGKYNDAIYTLLENDSVSITMLNNTNDHWGFQSNNNTHAGNAGHTTGSNSGFVPDLVLDHYWFVQNDSATLIVTGSGIKNENTYSLNMGGSRTSNGSRITRYHVAGITKSSEAINNTNGQVNFSEVSPVAGEIAVSIANSNNQFGYLNWIEVWELQIEENILETGDSPETAYELDMADVKNVPLTLNGTTAGLNEVLPMGSYNHYQKDEPNAWYTFIYPSDVDFLKIDYTPANGLGRVVLYDENGIDLWNSQNEDEPLIERTSTGDGRLVRIIPYDLVVGDRYYLTVYKYYGGSDYDLQISATHSPGDSPETAYELDMTDVMGMPVTLSSTTAGLNEVLPMGSYNHYQKDEPNVWYTFINPENVDHIEFKYIPKGTNGLARLVIYDQDGINRWNNDGVDNPIVEFKNAVHGSPIEISLDTLSVGKRYFITLYKYYGGWDFDLEYAAGFNSSDFITTWNTENPGESSDSEITIPTAGGSYNYSVSWQELGNTANIGSAGPFTGNATIQFGSPGTYRVSISGEFPRIYFNNQGDKDKLLSVEQWGDQAWTSMKAAFNGCSNMVLNASDQPDLTQATSIEFAFANTSNFNQSINDWDVSSINKMVGVFQHATAFNQPLSLWDISNVTTLQSMFFGATNFNQDLSSWDVSNVNSLRQTFRDADAFNQPIGGWDVGKVTDMYGLFRYADAFNQPLDLWDVSQVTNISYLFSGTAAFNQDINSWNVSSATNMNSSFRNAASFNQSLGDWDIGSVTDISGMFINATLSRENYDQTLQGWATLQADEVQIPQSLSLGANGLEFCNEQARSILVDNQNWTITGDNPAASGCFDDAPIFVNFGLTFQPSSPWNNVLSLPGDLNFTDLLDGNGQSTGISISNDGLWAGNSDPVFSDGATTGNDSGLFPDLVMTEYYYFGIFNVPDVVTLEMQGLDPGQTYHFTFFGSSIWSGATENGATVYTINGEAAVLDVQGNTDRSVTLNYVSPDAAGNVVIQLSKTEGTPVGYINALVISPASAPYSLSSPGSFNAVFNSDDVINLSWIDNSDIESGFELERSADGGASYQVLRTLGPNISSYSDTLTNAGSYSYRIRATEQGSSTYSAYSIEKSIEFAGLPSDDPPASGDSVLVARINFGGVGASPNLPGWSNPAPWQKNVTGGKYNNVMYALSGNDSISITMFNNTNDHWGFQNNNNTHAGNTGYTTGNDSGITPDLVLDHYWFVENDSATLSITGSGIKEGRRYSLNMGGSRTTSGSRLTSYRVEGISKKSESMNNSADFVNFSNISPASEQLHISVSNSNHQFGYLNWIEVWELSENNSSTPGIGDLVHWRNHVNVIETASSGLDKTIVSNTWDAGASSFNKLRSNEDGWIEFVIDDLDDRAVIGISSVDTDETNNTIDHGIFLHPDGARIRESGVNMLNFGTSAIGDVIKIARVGATIQYFVNNELLREVSNPATEELVVDVSIHVGGIPAIQSTFYQPLRVIPSFVYVDGEAAGIELSVAGGDGQYSYSWSDGSTGSTLTGPMGQYTVTVSDGAGEVFTGTYHLGYTLEWTNHVNLIETASGGLDKSIASNTWDAGASSVNKLQSNEDGWMEFVVDDLDARAVIGLSNVDTDETNNTIDHGIFLHPDGARIRESGVEILNTGTSAIGDVLKIARVGATVQYFVNNVLLREVSNPAMEELILDVSIHVGSIPVIHSTFYQPLRVIPSFVYVDGEAAGIELSVAGGDGQYSYSWSDGSTGNTLTGPMGQYTVTVSDGAGETFTGTYHLDHNLEWTNHVNLIETASGGLDKSIASNTWDAGASSVNKLRSNEDGWIELVVEDLTEMFMFGLSTIDADFDYSTIEHAIFINPVVSDRSAIYEDGVKLIQFPDPSLGDKFQISREGGMIRYYRNGTLLREVSNPVEEELIVDLSINKAGIPAIQSTFYQAPPLMVDSTLLGHYAFSGSAYDSSSYEKHGTIYGATLIKDRFGNPDAAYQFDGVNDHIDLGDDFDEDSLTINLWFKPDLSTSAAHQILLASDHNAKLFGLWSFAIVRGDANNFDLRFNRNGSLYSTAISDKYYMATIMFKGHNFSFFLDGELLFESTDTGHRKSQDGVSVTTAGATRLRDRFYKGILDDIRIYKRTLTNDELSELYTLPPPDPFITTWKTDNPGASSDTQITIATHGSGYDYTLKWKEVGNPANAGSVGPFFGDATIDFPSAGVYQVSISGDFPRIGFGYSDDRRKIIELNQWGDQIWTSMGSAFAACDELLIKAEDLPDLSSVIDMTAMLKEIKGIETNLNDWDVSSVIRMGQLFNGTDFNLPIDSWDVSNVVDMNYLFAFSNFNQSIAGWNVGNVTTMKHMFRDATEFNQNLNHWNVANVIDMAAMFRGASSFNGDVSSWDVKNVTNMPQLFALARSFNGDISDWDVSSVRTMLEMFHTASNFNQDIGAWNTSNVTDMRGMFNRADAFNQDISGWDLSKVWRTRGMFYHANNFNQNLSTWDVSNVRDMESMFNDAFSFNQNLGLWDISSVDNMRELLKNTDTSPLNYEATLNGWSTLDPGEVRIPENIEIGVYGLSYCDESGRDELINEFGWTFLGDDLSQTCGLPFWTISDGDWSDPSIWSNQEGGSAINEIPRGKSEVIINGHSVVVSGNQVSGNLTLNSTTVTNNSELIVQGQLTVTGKVRIKKSPDGGIANLLTTPGSNLQILEE